VRPFFHKNLLVRSSLQKKDRILVIYLMQPRRYSRGPDITSGLITHRFSNIYQYLFVLESWILDPCGSGPVGPARGTSHRETPLTVQPLKYLTYQIKMPLSRRGQWAILAHINSRWARGLMYVRVSPFRCYRLAKPPQKVKSQCPHL